MDGSTVIGHISLSSQDVHDKTKLWNLILGHVS